MSSLWRPLATSRCTYIHTYTIYLIKQVEDQNWQDAKSWCGPALSKINWYSSDSFRRWEFLIKSFKMFLWTTLRLFFYKDETSAINKHAIQYNDLWWNVSEVTYTKCYLTETMPWFKQDRLLISKLQSQQITGYLPHFNSSLNLLIAWPIVSAF